MDNPDRSSAAVIWRSLLGITMVLAGCGCFILACVTAMIVAGKE